MQLSPRVEEIVKEIEGSALRRIDIVRWESDAGRQVTGEFGSRGIPYLRVVDRDGDLLYSGNGLGELDRIREVLRDGSGG